MDSSNFFKMFFQPRMGTEITEELLQAIYDQGLLAYIDSFQKKNPGVKLWIHAYDTTSHLFFINGETKEFSTRMVRLMYHGGPKDGHTFTFCGTMFVLGSKFSKQFILFALSKGKKSAAAKAETSCRTLHRWRHAFRLHMDKFADSLARALDMLACEGQDGPDSERCFQSCLFILMEEEGRFPLWSLS